MLVVDLLGRLMMEFPLDESNVYQSVLVILCTLFPHNITMIILLNFQKIYHNECRHSSFFSNSWCPFLSA